MSTHQIQCAHGCLETNRTGIFKNDKQVPLDTPFVAPGRGGGVTLSGGEPLLQASDYDYSTKAAATFSKA